MHKGVSADLKRIVGSEGVLDDPVHMSRYMGDALGTFRAFGAASRITASVVAVAFPSNPREISAILRYAQQHNTPIIPYGGGTGVMGAAATIQDGIILSMERMNSAVSVSTDDMTARFQAGIVLEDAARILKGEGMLLGHDPWSRPIATVGGAISTNGVGYTAAKYGSMGEQVLGLEAVLANGEIIRTIAVPNPSIGASLNHLLIGAEGVFGIITEATLRTFPIPEKRIIRTVDFPDFESGFHSVSQMYAEGVRPTMVDYGEEFWPEQSSAQNGAALYLSFEGFAEDTATQWAKTLEICKRFGGSEGNRQEALQFWQMRHNSGERYKQDVLQSAHPAKARKQHSSLRMDYLHVALPVSKVLEYRERCKRIFADNRILVREWSLWARPEFFSFLIVQEDDECGDADDMGRVVDEALTLAQQMGGSMEYCHGVGVKLSHLMEAELGGGLNVLRSIKRSVDPANILNPGKLLG